MMVDPANWAVAGYAQPSAINKADPRQLLAPHRAVKAETLRADNERNPFGSLPFFAHG